VIKTKISVRIGRPVDEVFAYVTTLENFPRWMRDLVRAAAHLTRLQQLLDAGQDRAA
jgi:uncharacterized protein YndB with AHSA1/START domain